MVKSATNRTRSPLPGTACSALEYFQEVNYLWPADLSLDVCHEAYTAAAIADCGIGIFEIVANEDHEVCVDLA